MRLGMVHLRAQPVADPDFWLRAFEEPVHNRLAAAGRNAVRHRRGRAEHPLPASLPFNARRCFIGSNHGRRAHLGIDAFRLRGERRGGAAEYVGDGPFANLKPDQPLEHFHQAVVADHVPGMQIDRQRGDTGAEWAARQHTGGRGA